MPFATGADGKPLDPRAFPISIMYGEATPLDQSFAVMRQACQFVGGHVRPLVVGSDGSAVTGLVKKAPSGTAIASGTAISSTTIDFKGTINTNQALAVTATAADANLAAGDAVGIDTTGTMTAARGCATLWFVPLA